MEWRFRISGAYIWGTELRDASAITPGHGDIRIQSSTINTSTAEQAHTGLESLFSVEELPGHFRSHARGPQNDKASDATVAAPQLADIEHGALPDDEGDPQKIEGLSLRIASLLAEAEVKDTTIKNLESALNTRCSEHLQHQQQGSALLDEAGGARLAELKSALQSERDEHLKAEKQVASLLEEVRAKDARVKEMESSNNTGRDEPSKTGQEIAPLLDNTAIKDRLKELESNLNTKCGEYSEAKQEIASLLKDAIVKDARVKELESSLNTKCGEHSQAEQQITALIDDTKVKDARVKELESSLNIKCGEHSQAEQQITALIDDTEVKDARIKELEFSFDAKRGECSKAEQRITSLLDDAMEKDARLRGLQSNLDTKRGEHLEAEQRVASLLDEAKAKGARIEQLESSLSSERDERMTLQQLYASLRQTIRVMVRIRPPLPDAQGAHVATSWTAEPGSGMLEIPASESRNNAITIRFDRVFRPQASNKDVFDEILPLVRQAATEGGRCVIMAYGASSTGKSYTMRGEDKGPTPSPGIIQLAGGRLFGMISARATVEVSSMYAYKGEVWDLLAAKKDRNLDIPATQKACTPTTIYKQVLSVDDLVGRFDSTMLKTIKAPTLLNAESSRGHYFFNVRISGQPGDAGTGMLTFVDLAGNESVKESGVQGEQFTESKNINSDLFHLGEMIRKLRQGQSVDTKRSKLTQLLAGVMGLGTDATARSEVLVLTTVNLSDGHMEKSRRTLKFAEMAIGTPAKKSKA